MNEHEEHRDAMQEPERFTLELPPGHVGRRPFAAAREALRGVREAEDRFRPDLDRILAGDSLTAEEVARVLQEVAALGAAIHHCLHCVGPIHVALVEVMTP